MLIFLFLEALKIRTEQCNGSQIALLWFITIRVLRLWILILLLQESEFVAYLREWTLAFSGVTWSSVSGKSKNERNKSLFPYIWKAFYCLFIYLNNKNIKRMQVVVFKLLIIIFFRHHVSLYTIKTIKYSKRHGAALSPPSMLINILYSFNIFS